MVGPSATTTGLSLSRLIIAKVPRYFRVFLASVNTLLSIERIFGHQQNTLPSNAYHHMPGEAIQAPQMKKSPGF